MAVFDLTKVTKLVENKKPARILIIDTNVIMNEPDYDNWKVEDDDLTLFVLSTTTFTELESIRQKRGKPNSEAFQKATSAVNSMAGLFKKGDITEGIPIRAGWVVGIPSPKKELIDPELEQMEEIDKTFHRSDTKLLLLTRECHQDFKAVPVTLITGDKGFFGVVNTQGVPSYLHSGFPIQHLKTASALSKPIDWKEVIDGTEEQVDELSVAVEVTLTSIEIVSPWLKFHIGSKDFEIAEGFSIVNLNDDVQPFLWTISYYQQPFLSNPKGSPNEKIDQPAVYLDFFSNEPSQQILDGIANRLIETTSLSFEENIPTLQNPESIMTISALFEHIASYGTASIFNKQQMMDFWKDEVFDIEDQEEKDAIIGNLFYSIDSYWKLGQTYKFNIIKE